jgi:hypothetical protein
MIWLNEVNGADKVCQEFHQRIMKDFHGTLYGAILGSAYGGELEYLGKLWKGRGLVYGFDVFDDTHPKHLADDVNSFEAICMDHWYNLPEYGREKMAYDYQRTELDKLELDNVILVKGEVHPESCKDIPELHYAFLDMDIPFSMKQGYAAVKDKIVRGGYLFIHDTQNIAPVGEWYREEVLGKDGEMWEPIGEWSNSFIVGLKRK